MQALARFFLAHGEDAQFLAYFALLGALLLVERALPARRQAAPRGARLRTNFVVTAVNVVALGALPFSFLTGARWAEERSLGLLHAVALPAGVVVALNLAGRAFISWLTHLLMHKVPLFWRVHRVHHTDTELDVSTTVRFHPLEFPLGLVVGLPLVLVFGLSPWLLLLYEVLDVVFTLFSHANLELPPRLERLLATVVVTPGLHRVHHSVRPEETDSNFGAVFPFWDQVFGTYRRLPREASLTMPLGLAEVRDERTTSVAWLLGSPFRSLPAAQGSAAVPAPPPAGARLQSESP